jgi:hypothetical protein
VQVQLSLALSQRKGYDEIVFSMHFLDLHKIRITQLTQRVIMLKLKVKKIAWPVFFCLFAGLTLPSISQAELGGSGGTAARDAAEQKANKAKKLEKKRLEAEAKKAGDAQQAPPAETQPQPEATEQKPAAQ